MVELSGSPRIGNLQSARGPPTEDIPQQQPQKQSSIRRAVSRAPGVSKWQLFDKGETARQSTGKKKKVQEWTAKEEMVLVDFILGNGSLLPITSLTVGTALHVAQKFLQQQLAETFNNR